MKHLDYELIVEYCEGYISNKDRKIVETHLDKCEKCVDEILTLRRFNMYALTDPISQKVEVPENLTKIVMNLFEANLKPASKKRVKGTVQKVLDKVLDTIEPIIAVPKKPALVRAGARSYPEAQIKQFNAGDVTLNLQITESLKVARRINGKLLSVNKDKWVDSKVNLLLSNKVLTTTTIDNFGDFRFHFILPEKYGLLITSDKVEKPIEIKEIEID